MLLQVQQGHYTEEHRPDLDSHVDSFGPYCHILPPVIYATTPVCLSLRALGVEPLKWPLGYETFLYFCKCSFLAPVVGPYQFSLSSSALAPSPPGAAATAYTWLRPARPGHSPRADSGPAAEGRDHRRQHLCGQGKGSSCGEKAAGATLPQLP